MSERLKLPRVTPEGLKDGTWYLMDFCGEWQPTREPEKQEGSL